MKRKVSLALFMVALIAVIGIFFQRKTESAPKSAGEIGNPLGRTNSLEFIGNLNQTTIFHQAYGYITHIDGLADQELFTDASLRNETTARFTFVSEVILTSHHKVGSLITTASEGAMAIYFTDSPAGNFNDPTSFAQGQLIAKYNGRFHTVCDVATEVSATNPGMGIITMNADVVQDTANSFTLDGDPFRLGHMNFQGRLYAQAHGNYTVPAPDQQAQTSFGGYVAKNN